MNSSHPVTDTLAVPHRRACLHDIGMPRPTEILPFAGAQITTLKGITDGYGESGLGRIAGFGVFRNVRRWSELRLFTNAHVLNAFGASIGDTVFQPRIIRRGDSVRFAADSLNPIAALEDRGYEGPYRFAYPGEEPQDYFIDCATARLFNLHAFPSGATAFRQVARAHPLDILSNRTLSVRLAGLHDRPTGRVTSVTASVKHADGRIFPNCIVIETLPARPPFAGEGDSGALLVDDFDRAIGLLWGVNLETPTIAYACHIHPVLDHLRLSLSQRMTVAPRTTGETDYGPD